LVGWDNVPMHRWAQSQLFRSFCFLLRESKRKGSLEASQGKEQILTARIAG